MKVGKKNKLLYHVGILIAFILVINGLASFYFVRFDLTQEKRYTLSQVSKETLQSLPDQVMVRIYLYGDLPLSFRKFSQTIREMLDEFRVYAGAKLQYEFIDPYESKDEKQIQANIEKLYRMGLQPTSVKMQDPKGGYSEKMVIPGAIVSYGNRDFAVNLLSNNPAFSGEENLNHSVQNLEYNLINAIRCVIQSKVEKVAFLEGHGEWDEYHTGDMMKALSNYFQVDRGRLKGDVNELKPYKCLIIAGPTLPFTEEDKFIIDQYIMGGGKVLWLLDAVSIDRDSFAQGNAYATIAQLNLDDMLFKYGVRLNPVLVQDIQCALIPIASGSTTGQAKFVPTPWPYFPLIAGAYDHPVSRNLNLIKLEFASYIDTLNVPNVHHTVLLKTSKYSRLKSVPSFVRLSEIRNGFAQEEFNNSYLPVAVLLEGVFPSVFQNRMLSALKITGNYTFRPHSNQNKMLVVADGDIIRNQVRQTQRGILITPLGFDSYTSQIFGNKDFLLNAVQYLTDEKNIIDLRSRNIELRLLDKAKILDQATKWKIINTLLPLVIIIFSGIVFFWWRNKKYT
ncbi:MAG: gliding motility-associated ABC transporter substrate-binding protein GldG [Bacteroidales bacterium]|nr:gliding motility-associated ABC transporter substrate-binding protein GldG [Bacteroidales bacterium]